MATYIPIPGQLVTLSSIISDGNSTSAPLLASVAFTGITESSYINQSVICAIKTDQSGTLFLEQSKDGINWDSSLSFSVTANTDEVHRLTLTNIFFRVRYVNGSVAQTYFRCTTIYGATNHLTSNLNSVIQQDADATVVRSIAEEVAIVQGLFQNYSITNKFGTNSDVDIASLPEDVWEGGGAYTGFPDSTLETISVLSSSASDAAAGTGARTVRIFGLDGNYDEQSETITLNGITPVASIGTYRRCYSATVMSAGSGGVNVGVITARHTTTVANIFVSMLAGRNQTNTSAFTVPAGYTAYMRFLHVALNQTTASASGEGYIWTRPFNGVFRTRRPFIVSNGFRLSDQIYGGLVFTEKSDIVIRISNVSNNNTLITAGYDLLVVKN